MNPNPDMGRLERVGLRRSHMWGVAAFGCMALLLVAALWSGARRSTHEVSEPLSASKAIVDRDGGDSRHSDVSQVASSASQWPTDNAARIVAMSNRAEKVVSEVGQAAGKGLVAHLGGGPEAVVVEDDGSVVLDTAIVWRLSENALASLVAYGVSQYERGLIDDDLDSPRPDAFHATASLSRAQRQARTDECAGELVARAGYGPVGYRQMLLALRITHAATNGSDPGESIEQRVASFQRGYESVIQLMEAGELTTRPLTELNGTSQAPEDVLIGDQGI